MIHVLIVDDSPVMREYLLHLIGSDPQIQVVGTAQDGEEALEAVESLKPNVITMDMHMPRMNGLESTRKIMETRPTPIIILAGSSEPDRVRATFHALEAGAVTMIERPRGLGHLSHPVMKNELLQTIKVMSEVKLIRRLPSTEKKVKAPAVSDEKIAHSAPIQLVAFGASTGGPTVLQTILAALPKKFPVPILIVQHISTGFAQGFVDWLSQTTGQSVHLAKEGELICAGQVYVAPDGFQMKVAERKKILLAKEGPVNGHLPSVSSLFYSVAEEYGENAAGVLLTGMGRDGADGLMRMKERGAVTFAQDEKTSVVYGMPSEAFNLGAVNYKLPPEKIAAAVVKLTADEKL